MPFPIKIPGRLSFFQLMVDFFPEDVIPTALACFGLIRRGKDGTSCDALVPFRPKREETNANGIGKCVLLRVDVLTDDQDLMAQIDEALCLLRARVKPVDQIDEAKDRIKRGDVDLTVVHVYRADAWPGVAFKLFDDDTSRHPIIVLCGNAEEARHYQKFADYVVDILPENAAKDYRFRFLIQGAMLRADLSSDQRENECPPAA